MSPPLPHRATSDKPPRPAAGSGAWLSLGPASRLLGVDPDTLRRWADSGRLAAYMTPGGHRRFDRRDLELTIEARRVSSAMPRLATLGATPDRLTRAYARSYRRREDGRSQLGDRFGTLDREAFRADGRRLLAALLGYLDAVPGAARARWESEAAAAVRATGARLAAGGAGVHDAVATFIAARRPFLAELSTLGRRRSLDVASLTDVYDEAVALLDRLLLEFLSAFSPRSSRQGVPE